MSGTRLLFWAVVLALLLLNWAALDDITTGTEPSYAGEYATVLVSALLVMGWLGWRMLRRRRIRQG